MEATTTAAPPTCDGRASGVAATDWGFTSLPCNTSRGLTTYTDTEGTERRYCVHHRIAVQRRWPAHDVGCPARIGEDCDEAWETRKARIDAAISADPEHESIR